MEAGERGRKRKRKNGDLVDGTETDRLQDVRHLAGECLRGVRKEAVGGDVAEDHPRAVEPLLPDVGHLPDAEGPRGEVLPHAVGRRQGEDLRQGVTSVAGMTEAVDPGGPALPPGEVVRTEEGADGLLLDVVLPRGEVPRPGVTKDGLMEGSGDGEDLRDGGNLLQDVVALLRGVVVLQGVEILLRGVSETILQQDVMTDRTTGAVTGLPLLPLALPLPETTNPLRPNPLASLMKVGPRWPNVRRPQVTVWG